MSETKTINILFITRKFPPSVGGMERFAADLATSLNKKAQIRLIKWGGSNKWLPLVLPIFFVRACWALLTKPIDIIHIQDGLQLPMGLVLKTIFRRPMVVVIHGLDITYINRLYQAVIPNTLKCADQVFCVSHAAVDEVVKRGIDANKVSFVPLGVTDDLFIDDKTSAKQQTIKELNLDPKAKIILSTGRLVKRKGVAWFTTNILPELVEFDNKVVFLVSGDGPEKEAIVKSIEDQNLTNNVQLLGRTSDQLLKRLYNGSDVFVMPNIKVEGDMEGFGRVLLEAALCELPVVATGIEGITDAIIDGKNGILVNEKDQTAFIKEIQKLLSDKKQAKDFGHKARNYSLEHYNWDKIAQDYLDVYYKLCDK